jgi:hypothetical protein
VDGRSGGEAKLVESAQTFDVVIASEVEREGLGGLGGAVEALESRGAVEGKSVHTVQCSREKNQIPPFVVAGGFDGLLYRRHAFRSCERSRQPPQLRVSAADDHRPQPPTHTLGQATSQLEP